MKLKFVCLLLSFFLFSCESQQKVIASWVNKEHLPKEPYNSFFLFGITANNETRYNVEMALGNLVTSRGKEIVRSSDLFPMSMHDIGLTKEKLESILKEKKCELVITLSLLDVKTETHYTSGTTYSPYNYGYYGNYYGYYNYYAPIVYSPGYYTTDKTFYVETNFYDVNTDYLICSIQSSAYNPGSFKSWFNDYAKLILAQLKKEKLIKA